MVAYDCLQSLPDIECPVRPQANIPCFRLRGDDALQLRIRDQLIAAGRFYLSTTAFRGQRYLRAVFMNPRTDLVHVEQLVAEVQRLGEG